MSLFLFILLWTCAASATIAIIIGSNPGKTFQRGDVKFALWALWALWWLPWLGWVLRLLELRRRA